MMEGPGANSEEKHEPASYIDTALVDSLKALDPEGPIREADIVGSGQRRRGLSAGSGSPSVCAARGGGSSAPKSSKAVLNVGLTFIRPISPAPALSRLPAFLTASGSMSETVSGDMLGRLVPKVRAIARTADLLHPARQHRLSHLQLTAISR